MVPDIKLKLATSEDLEAMTKAGDSLFDNPVKPDRAIEFLNDARHHLVLAYDGEELIGMVSGFHYVHPDKDPSLFINEAGVIVSRQGEGIGRKMIQFMCDYAKEQGFMEAWVATEQSNTAARKSYTNAGGVEDPNPIVLIEFNLEPNPI